MPRSKTLFFSIILAILVGAAHSTSATTAIIYSFSDVPMINGIAGDEMLYASGNFSIPAHNFGPIPTLTSQLSSPLSVNFTVTNGSNFTRTLVDPLYFWYSDGIGVDNSYYVGISIRGPLDARWDQFYLTIVNDEMISTLFTSLEYPRGYFAPNPLPLASVIEPARAPEPASLVLLSLGLAGVGWSRRKK